MNQETQRIMEALMLIYGKDLQAATITVLLKDGDTAFRFLSSTFPQVEPPNKTTGLVENKMRAT
jgi:hypothetical protein